MLAAVSSCWVRLTVAAAALHGGIGVTAGAFGAHLLAARLSERQLQVWRTATTYEALHAACLLALAALQAVDPASRYWRAAALGFAVGAALFAWSLYGLALDGPRGLGPITPLGGALLLAGWAALAGGAVFGR